jgi:hypothetical protein
MLLFPGLLVGGCVERPSSRLARGQIAQATASAAAQIKRCYRQPRVPSEVRQIVTRLRVRYRIDGGLAEPPILVWQSGVDSVTSVQAEKMAEAAKLAVIRCAPLRLPPEYYAGGWDEFDLTFSPGAVV